MARAQPGWCLQSRATLTSMKPSITGCREDMAEALGLGASIVGIASTGVALVTALSKFSISYRGSNKKIDDLAARLSMTATILRAIGETVEANEGAFRKDAFKSTWNEVLMSCQLDYGKVNDAIFKAKGKGNDTRLGKMSAWRKLIWALGGEDEIKDLELSLDRSCKQIMMMQQVIQMTALEFVAKRLVKP